MGRHPKDRFIVIYRDGMTFVMPSLLRQFIKRNKTDQVMRKSHSPLKTSTLSERDLFS